MFSITPTVFVPWPCIFSSGCYHCSSYQLKSPSSWLYTTHLDEKFMTNMGTGKFGGCIINLLCLLALYTLQRLGWKYSALALHHQDYTIMWGYVERCAFGNTHFHFASFFIVWSSWAWPITDSFHSKMIWHSSSGARFITNQKSPSKHYLVGNIIFCNFLGQWNWNFHTNQTKTTLHAPIRGIL